jgi:hypothetical protein
VSCSRLMSEGLRPRQALTASSRSTPSRRTAGSHSPWRARAMMRFARNSLSSCLSLVRSTLRQTSSRAMDIASISSGPKTSDPKKAATFIVFLSTHRSDGYKFRASSTLPATERLQLASMLLPSIAAVQQEFGLNPYKSRFVNRLGPTPQRYAEDSPTHLVNAMHCRN